MLLSTKRISPGDNNNWFIKIRVLQFVWVESRLRNSQIQFSFFCANQGHQNVCEILNKTSQHIENPSIHTWTKECKLFFFYFANCNASNQFWINFLRISLFFFSKQAWHVEDIGYQTAYPTITGGIFEFGFTDAILQMWGKWSSSASTFFLAYSLHNPINDCNDLVLIVQYSAAFCDEFVNGKDKMIQPFYCATPEEAYNSHVLFTSALQSNKTGQTVKCEY